MYVRIYFFLFEYTFMCIRINTCLSSFIRINLMSLRIYFFLFEQRRDSAYSFRHLRE
ncbi:hypothetical protein GIB67_020445, partial [Kingdonia uniflora]